MVRDPLGFAAGDVNLYRYVGNEPPNFNDPFGLVDISPQYNMGWQYDPAIGGAFF